ncbi:hypothetical protein [Dapis sp. BLCC M126]
MLILIYNRVDNIPVRDKITYRPEYLASRNYKPLEIAIPQHDV